jgi:hypothetical protein
MDKPKIQSTQDRQPYEPPVVTELGTRRGAALTAAGADGSVVTKTSALRLLNSA